MVLPGLQGLFDKIPKNKMRNMFKLDKSIFKRFRPKLDKNTRFENQINEQTYGQRAQNNNSKHYVYQWKNYDYDYKAEVKKRFNPKKMGFKNEPYLNVFIQNVAKLPKYIDVLVNKSVPGNNARAGISDIKNRFSNKKTMNNRYDRFGEPYPGFSREYPSYVNKIKSQGKYASSYFQRSGYCPAKGIDKNLCNRKKYHWLATKKIFNSVKTDFKNMKNDYTYVNLYNSNKKYTGINVMLKDINGHEYFIVKGNNGNFTQRLNKTLPLPLNKGHFIEIVGGKYNGLYFQNMGGKCNKPRYAYIENKPGSVMGDGLVGSVQQSIMELNPVQMASILLTEKGIKGKFKVLPCKEPFIGSSGFSLFGHKKHMEIYILIIVIILCIIMALLTFKK